MRPWVSAVSKFRADIIDQNAELAQDLETYRNKPVEIPSGKLTELWKITLYSKCSHEKL